MAVHTLVLGGEITVPTLAGNVTLKVPAGTQSDTTMRLRGQGMPGKGDASPGDLLIRIQAEIPTTLSAKAREHYDALQQLADD